MKMLKRKLIFLDFLVHMFEKIKNVFNNKRPLVKGTINLVFTSSYQKYQFGVFPVLVLIIFLLSPFQGKSQSQLIPVVIESTELAIRGNTNVNSFTCQLLKPNLHDTLKFVPSKADEAILFSGLVLKFNVSDFACDHNAMTRDFKTLLKAEDFPYIIMNINEVVVQKPSEKIGSQSISAHVTLYIAGQPKREYIENAYIKQSDQSLALTGSHLVLMSDFNIEPPTKLFGAVRTEDAIEILFSIKLK